MSAPLSAKAVRIFVGILRAILKPLPREPIWRWLERHVVVPAIVGSRASGPLDTSIMPIWRGLLEKYAHRRTHFFTLCKAARIGGTLFFGICLILEKVGRWPGPIGWLDPTGKTAKSVSRREIEPFLRECAAVYREAIISKTTWTVLEKFFRSCILSILGAGSITDLGGRQWELVIINEQDRIPSRSDDSPTPSQEAEARSSQFEDTRKIVRNSTPFIEAGLTWGEYLAGSQDHAYLPCPQCYGYQRLTMFKDPAEPDRWFRVEASDPILAPLAADESGWIWNNHVDEATKNERGEIKSFAGLKGKRPPDTQRPSESKHVRPSGDGETYLVKGIPPTGRMWWPPECKDKRSGRWDADKVGETARYECAYCQAKITHDMLPWMLDRYQLRSHNIFASRDHVSAQVSALYSPWQTWGSIAKQWILAQGLAAKLRAFWNLVLGLPFVSAPTKLTPKHIALLQSHSPRFERQYPEKPDSELELPARPVCLTMHADVQQTEFWWTIRALLPDGSRYLIAWGSCGSFTELDNIASRNWTFDHGEGCPAELRYESFSCYTQIAGIPIATCIIDTGYKAKRQGGVYEFLHDQGGRWIGVRGGRFESLGREKPIAEDTVTFNYKGQGAVDIPVIKQNDFLLQEHLSRYVLKEKRPPGYYLPITLDEHLTTHLTSPHLSKRRLPDGRTEDIWNYECDPHLYDCEKYGEVLCHVLEPALLQQLRARQDAAREKALATLTR